MGNKAIHPHTYQMSLLKIWSISFKILNSQSANLKRTCKLMAEECTHSTGKLFLQCLHELFNINVRQQFYYIRQQLSDNSYPS